MRLGTWNLERGGHFGATVDLQMEVLDRLDVDVLVVTEPPVELSARAGVLSSPARRPGPRGPESWVAVVGRDVGEVGEPVPYGRMAVAVEVCCGGTRAVVYGAVLPWRAAPRHAPDLALPGESPAAMFARVLAEQEADLVHLKEAYPDAVVVWAGDFNQSLEGPNLTGSTAGRVLLEDSLRRLGMQAWNRHAPHAREGMCSIDLLCGPSDLLVTGLELIDPVRGGQLLSDHAGYVVDVHVIRRSLTCGPVPPASSRS